MKIKRALNTFKEKVTETADSLTETLDNIQDSATTKLNDVKKSTLGRKVPILWVVIQTLTEYWIAINVIFRMILIIRLCKS